MADATAAGGTVGADGAAARTDAVPGGTVGTALARAAATLGPVSETPRLDADLLLASVLGVDRSRLVIDRDDALPAGAADAFAGLVARRSAHEPVAYILGRRAFRRLVLEVDPRVLVPRPETELLVEVALELLPHGASVIDVGTGSGAIALAVKDERPDLSVRGVDISATAVDVARGNALRLSLDVAFSVGDLLQGVGWIDGVLANLPYVADDADLPDDVAAFEPAGALFGGRDGLDVVRRLTARLADVRPSLVALEIGPEQSAAVSELLRTAGFAQTEVRRDLAGRDRVVVGRRGP